MNKQPFGASKRVWMTRIAASIAIATIGGLGVALAINPLPTTVTDFYLKGTQPTPPFIDGEPNPAMREFIEPAYCSACHGDYAEAEEPYARWQHSMMAQAFRDPVFRAAFAIAQQDAPGSGDVCLRCHTPTGWIQARNTPSDGSSLTAYDKEGVTCHFCHRAVDPVYREGVSPAVDAGILQSLAGDAPDGLLNNSYVVDPKDRRRGPFDISPQNPHQWLQSAFHESADICAACHDTSNPAFLRQPNGTYAPTPFNAPHPTGNKYDMFPEQRTYSEWLMSAFAQGDVELGSNRYGGQNGDDPIPTPRTAYAECQSCHMPDVTGTGCNPFIGGPVRNDLPQHNFNGANTWVLQAVNNLFDPNESHLQPALINDAHARTIQMLQAASDIETWQTGDASNGSAVLNVRVINQTGHKLPTGFPEGRRMWLNVRFYDSQGQLLAERGHYDNAAATLTTADTKVYHTEHGYDQVVADATGSAPGPSFHLALNNVIEFDNRIPPRGYTLDGFASVQAAPVGYSYNDGQYWDDTAFAIPVGTNRADVRVFYQTSSREYMEFLRDNDMTFPFDNVTPWGTVAYEQWELLGKSAPVELDSTVFPVRACGADFNGDGDLNPDDLGDFITGYFTSPPDPRADWNHDMEINPDDLGDYITQYFSGSC